MRNRPFFILLLLALLPCAGSAHAEVRRCLTPDGHTIFTDRKCDEVGATQSQQPVVAPPAAARVQGRGCAHNLEDLVFEMTSAIDARDANRLASVYHWTGMSGDAAYQVWNRLDAVANRPLVDIVPVMPRVPADPPDATGHDGSPVASPPPPADPELYPQTAVGRAPVALRVEQTLANSVTPSRTVFSLTRNFGCLWLRF